MPFDSIITAEREFDLI